MTATVQQINPLEVCVKHLGTALVPLWGVAPDGTCLCPKGKACNAAGKHPNARLVPNGVKNATRDLAIIRQWVRQSSKSNWALRCGEPLPDGGFLGVLDSDPRNGSEESLAACGPLPETVTASTGGGGAHRLYRFPVPPKSRTVAPGLDLQGADKYIVIAPSRHHTGGVYGWEFGLAPGDVRVADAPSWLVEGTAEAQPRPSPDGGTARETVLGEAFARAGRAGAVMPDGTMLVNCPQSHLHSDNRGRGEDASCVVLPPAGGSRFGGFRCMHSHCQNLKWQDVVKMLPKEAVDEANDKYPRLGVVPDEPPPPPKPREPLSDDERDGKVIRDALGPRLAFKPSKSGTGSEIVSDEVNLNIILTYDPRWKKVFLFDEFAQQVRFARQPEWHPDDAPRDATELWNDNHVNCLNLWLRRNWGLKLTLEKIREGVYTVAKRDGINPLSDWLNSLSWDGTKRIDTWLSQYLGADDKPYTRAAGRKWLISAVARGMKPGSKVDTLLVLEGAQGAGKSTALRLLCPDPTWFSDTPIPIGDKDAYVGMKGKWIIELAELASLKKADLDRAKAFFSAPVDSYRPPYGREQVSIPRTCIFAGTVNLGEYLNDSTGNRRFWPVRVGVIDLAGIEADREQLWAEAAAAYKDWVARGAKQSECPWWPSPEETPLFEAEQEEREIRHPWTEPIARWLLTQRAHDILGKQRYLTVNDIGRHALEMADRDIKSNEQMAIGAIMTRELRWGKNRVAHNKTRIWAFTPPKG